MKRRLKPSDILLNRPGVKLVHSFRGEILGMTTLNGRLIVVTEHGCYVVDKTMKRWRKIKP